MSCSMAASATPRAKTGHKYLAPLSDSRVANETACSCSIGSLPLVTQYSFEHPGCIHPDLSCVTNIATSLVLSMVLRLHLTVQ
eukprot:m.32089 g.32089  ORF g.32089 m.32089 type:complete len:83 (-) comp9487_c2_seq2:206-454(-)